MVGVEGNKLILNYLSRIFKFHTKVGGCSSLGVH